jgi:hypothetical protein
MIQAEIGNVTDNVSKKAGSRMKTEKTGGRKELKTYHEISTDKRRRIREL